MPSFKENNLSFEFGEEWSVVKYDETSFYKDKMRIIDRTKGCDCLLKKTGFSGMFFLEIKDFRLEAPGYLDDLAIEKYTQRIAHQFKDTIPGIIGASRNDKTDQDWSPFKDAITDEKTPCKVVFWFEDELSEKTSESNSNKAKSRKNVFLQKLMSKMAWLTDKVIVIDFDDLANDKSPFPNLKVTDHHSTSRLPNGMA